MDVRAEGKRGQGEVPVAGAVVNTHRRFGVVSKNEVIVPISIEVRDRGAAKLLGDGLVDAHGLCDV